VLKGGGKSHPGGNTIQSGGSQKEVFHKSKRQRGQFRKWDVQLEKSANLMRGVEPAVSAKDIRGGRQLET